MSAAKFLWCCCCCCLCCNFSLVVVACSRSSPLGSSIFKLCGRALMNKLGLRDNQIIMHMTGCPNGCARPYITELALVGDGSDTYHIWLGGSPTLALSAMSVGLVVRFPLAPLRGFWGFREDLWIYCITPLPSLLSSLKLPLYMLPSMNSISPSPFRWSLLQYPL